MAINLCTLLNTNEGFRKYFLEPLHSNKKCCPLLVALVSHTIAIMKFRREVGKNPLPYWVNTLLSPPPLPLFTPN